MKLYHFVLAFYRSKMQASISILKTPVYFFKPYTEDRKIFAIDHVDWLLQQFMELRFVERIHFAGKSQLVPFVVVVFLKYKTVNGIY